MAENPYERTWKKHAPMNRPKTPTASPEYRDGWDRIFKKKKKKEELNKTA